jgi:hypothetical protein
MHETAVQLQMAIDMPKRTFPMTVVKMGIAAEHLLNDTSNVGVKVRGKARGFADPVIVLTGELRKGISERGRRCSKRSTRRLSGRRRSITRGEGSRRHWIGRVCRESSRIVDFPDYPLLYPGDVRRGRNLCRATILEPGICQAESCQRA